MSCSNPDPRQFEMSQMQFCERVLWCRPRHVNGFVEVDLSGENSDFLDLSFEGQGKTVVRWESDVRCVDVEDGYGKGVDRDGSENGEDEEGDSDDKGYEGEDRAQDLSFAGLVDQLLGVGCAYSQGGVT